MFYKKYLWIVICLSLNITLNFAVMPTFDRQNENVTVIIGNSAVLPCFISNLGDHKVAWIKVANMDILAIGDYKVTNDDRIKLLHGYVSDWSLSIQPINEEDAGEYICQVNTEPQIITRINLQVLLPPKIIEEKSTITPGPVKEGSTLTLYCHADGIPTPTVLWYFRNKKTIPSHHIGLHNQHNGERSNHVSRSNELVIQEGNTLTIHNISRAYTGIFECIANNSVPPAASRKIKVIVEFSPEIHSTNDKVDQIVGLDARFECKIKANPLVNHYWMKDGVVIENNLGNNYENQQQPSIYTSNTIQAQRNSPSSKYEINIYNQNSNDYLTVSALTIKNISKSDFGVYQCYAVNSHNTAKADFELKEIVLKRPAYTKATASRILVYSNNKNEQINHLNKNYKNYEDNEDYSLSTKLVKHQRKFSNNTSKFRQPNSNGESIKNIDELEALGDESDEKQRINSDQMENDSLNLFNKCSGSLYKSFGFNLGVLVFALFSYFFSY